MRIYSTGLTLLGAVLTSTALAQPLYYPHRPDVHIDAPEAMDGDQPGAKPFLDPNPKSKSGKWADIQATLPFADGPDTALQLTDGTVAIHDWCTGNWFRLTPDIKGRYETGTWSALAPMPGGYNPLFFASQILPDGRLIMNGGEYNGRPGNCGKEVWTKLGALYDPVADSWVPVTAPHGWQSIGDAQSIVLPDGSYMLAECCTEQEVIASISGTSVKWADTGTGKDDLNDEEGWTSLPGGNILTVDAWKGENNSTSNTEIYSTASGTWSAGQNTVSQLVDAGSHEIGPAVLMPNGFVVYFGADHSTGANNVFNSSTGEWDSAPPFPVIGGAQYDCADAPAALLPDGNVIVQASPAVFQKPSHFFEFSMNKKGTAKLTQVNDPKSAPHLSSFQGRFLELPTGQVLWENDGQTHHPEVATYTPKGKPKKAWLPVVSNVASTLNIGSTGNAITGTNFNGFSQGATYGDDAQMSTDYPLVRITNNSTGDVCFGRSYNFSTMGVWTSGSTSAEFDIPTTCESGANTLQVIVNGLASAGIAVTLQG
ncbi:MAG TPA: hypothetical protein VGK90_05185 [Rhizomicrobium sp.]